MRCTVEGCDRTDIHGHGLCRKHHWRWWKNGDPHVVTRAVGMCRLDAAPMVTAVRAVGRPVTHLLSDRERRAFYRSTVTGWVNDQHAEHILGAVGRSLEDTYGPAWDEVAA